MTFEAWLAEIQGTVTFVIEPDEWRKYYDAKLPPSTPSRSMLPTRRSDTRSSWRPAAPASS